MQGIKITANKCLEPQKGRNVLALCFAHTVQYLSFARVLRHFVLVPHEMSDRIFC